MARNYKPKAKKQTAKEKELNNTVRKVVKHELAVEAENKYLINTYSPTSINYDYPAIKRVSDIGAGVGVNQRVGNKIKVKHVHINGGIFPYSTTASTGDPCIVRMIVFTMTDDSVLTDTSAASLAQLLEGYGGTISSDAFCPYYPPNLGRFKVLTSKYFRVGSNIYDGSPQAIHVDEFVKMGLTLDFPSGASIAVKNAIYVAFTSTMPLSAGSPTFSGKIRVSFEDL